MPLPTAGRRRAGVVEVLTIKRAHAAETPPPALPRAAEGFNRWQERVPSATDGPVDGESRAQAGPPCPPRPRRCRPWPSP